ncbi:MAG: class I SAM-dependent methyltransferase [Candidatus Nanopelagicaceae bacterium]|nr:class I SAM-dependent methyltransferase [Candidatus Nanopelagicaceae bacterium]
MASLQNATGLGILLSLRIHDVRKFATGDRGQMPEQFIYTTEDMSVALDALLADRGGNWWDGFFSDRSKPIPFFVEWPDENLVEWFDGGLLTPGRVLELGCGHGRNALFLAGLGCSVDAIDFSEEAIEWAKERARSARIPVNFQCSSIFDATFDEGSYDLVYDSGCFHHLPPHRRKDYVELVRRALKPGGSFGLVCFRPEGGGGYTDRQVYEHRSLGGGMGYSENHLRILWDVAPFSMRVLRQMAKKDDRDSLFGEDFLWALLATKEGPS